MTKVYVSGSSSKFIPGHGTRAPGDFFEMPDDVAEGYAQLDNFSLTAPKQSRKTAATKAEQIEEDSE